MQNVPLALLIKDLEQEMIRLGYTEGTMNFYRRRWKKLLQFAKERGETCYSEQLGIDYVEKYFHIFEKDLNGTLSQSETQELRVIRMIGNFQLHRTILRRYYKHNEILTDQYFIQIRNRFKQYCSNKDYSKVTIDHYVKQSARFMDYLSSQKVTECKEIKLTLVNNYIKTLAGYTYKTVEQNICSIQRGMAMTKTIIIIGFITELAFLILFFNNIIEKIAETTSLATADEIWVTCGVIGLLTSIINFICRRNWFLSSVVFMIAIFILALYKFGLYLNSM